MKLITKPIAKSSEYDSPLFKIYNHDKNETKSSVYDIIPFKMYSQAKKRNKQLRRSHLTHYEYLERSAQLTGLPVNSKLIEIYYTQWLENETKKHLAAAYLAKIQTLLKCKTARHPVCNKTVVCGLRHLIAFRERQ